MHRLIVTSAAYRQSSRLGRRRRSERDAGDRLLWRKAPTRLEAEMVRDAMLAVSGMLDTKLGGPSFRDHEIVQAPGTPAMLYRAVDPSNARASTGGRCSAPGLAAAGAPCSTPSTAPIRRPPHPAGAVTTTPLQALSLMNNALVLYLVRRLRRPAGARGGARRRPAGRAGLPAGVRRVAPSPTSGRGPCGWSSGSGLPRWRGRSSTATSSSISIDRPGGRAIMDRRDFFSWVRNGLAGAAAASLMLRDGTLAGRSAGRGEPALSPLRAEGDPRDSHLPVRGDEPRRHVRLQAGADRRARPVAASRRPSPTSSSARSAGCASPTGRSGSAARAASGSRTCSRTWAEVADELTVIRSMVAETSNHTPATFQENSGFRLNGFPAMGAWLSYGLGSESDDLPAFVVIPDAREFPPAARSTGPTASCPPGTRAWSFGPQGEPIDDLFPSRPVAPEAESAARELVAAMNRRHLEQHTGRRCAGRPHSRLRDGRADADVGPARHRPRGRAGRDLALYGVDRPETPISAAPA